MKKHTLLSPFTAFAACWAFAQGISALAMDPAASQAIIAKLEHGPSKIDVSKYPPGIQENYELFTQKCSVCHKLSVPINSTFVTPDEWSAYVKTMMHKVGSNIGGDEGKKIYEFLVYDSSVRKKAALEAKLASVDPAQKAAAEAKIQAVRAKYDK